MTTQDRAREAGAAEKYDYYFYIASKSEPGCWDVIGVRGSQGTILCAVTSEKIAKNIIKTFGGKNVR